MAGIEDNQRLIGSDSRAIDGGLVTNTMRAIAPADRFSGFQQVRNLDVSEKAVVDEAFLRGASVEDAMGILFARALSKTDAGDPSARYRSVTGMRGGGGLLAGGQEWFPEYSQSIESPVLDDMYPRQVSEIENLRPSVVSRYDAYAALAKAEYDKLKFAQPSFTPIRSGNCPDSYATPEEKYRVMRGAYYRAGYTSIKSDILDHISPTTFFGIPVKGGTHEELSRLLANVEQSVLKINPGVGNRMAAAGFVIGGFVPRFQCGSDQLSNHAFGLAIDIDGTWNPQLKKSKKNKNVIEALKRATGERVDQLFQDSSSIDAIRRIYARVEAASKKLQLWLNQFMPKLEQFESERSKLKGDKKAKEKVAAMDGKMKSDPDLAALSTLISEFTKPTIEAWRAYGIITIPKEVVEQFVELGRPNWARWGGEYEDTKDIMHLELLQLASPDSPGRPGGPGRRRPVKGLDDLYSLDGNPIPINGPK